MVCAQLSYFLTISALPLYLQHVGAPVARIGIDIGIGSVVALSLTLLVGPLLNRVGTRVFLALGAVIYVVACALMLAIQLEGSIVVGRVLQGAGSALVVPSVYAAIPLIAAKKMSSAIGIVGTISNLPLAVGPALGLALCTHGGPAYLFIPAIVLGMMGLGLALALRLPRPRVAAQSALRLGFDSRWTGPLIANGLQGVYFGAILAYLPLVLAQTHGPNAGIFFTADALGVIILRIPSGILADRTQPAVPMVLGLAITLLGLAAFVPTATVLTLALAGAGTGIGAGLFSNGLLTQLLSMSSEENRGTAMSFAVASVAFGVFLGSTAAGLLIGHIGFTGVIAIGGVCCAVGLPLATFGGPGKPRVAPAAVRVRMRRAIDFRRQVAGQDSPQRNGHISQPQSK